MTFLSQASKMPGKSWSLNAGKTCPGSIDPRTKEVLPVCASCYAKEGNYVYPNVINPRNFNQEDWKRAEFVNDMITLLDNERYFRWFDSGDVYHPALAFKIYLIMKATPWCNHWLPTKSYNIPKIRVILDKMKELPNVSVRFSSPSISGEYTVGLHGSTVIPYSDDKTEATICEAYTRDGKCGTCRACWKKDIAVIAYPAHGKRMSKSQRINNGVKLVKFKATTRAVQATKNQLTF